MLKDILSKFQNNKIKDPLNVNIMDGFVDIKGYKVLEDGKKKLIYHDCGDNVVTDWMRHTIMVMLTGSVFSKNGNCTLSNPTAVFSRQSEAAFSMLGQNDSYHTAKDSKTVNGATINTTGKNLDGYLLNGKQYFFNSSEITEKYSRPASSLANENLYAYFPTKVLFGTGKEYSSWDVLQTENETANATWYTEMINSYGGDVTTAKNNFDTNIDITCNTFSGSISKNIYSGNGNITKMRTVNDPDTSSNIISTTSTMNKNYGVVGAVKTFYFDEVSDNDYLQTTLSDSGKLLKPINRGVGRPCFIYFNTPQENLQTKEGWDDPSAAEVSLAKDNSSSYLNKITFSITMPAQSAADNAVGKYYPYNGYTLKQMGLYNDALLTTGVDASNDLNNYAYNNMKHGMLLAVKNITSFQKTADVELKLTWTLTI